ncbi:hypothetical protein [Paracoccus endophyticus]|uniref:hypothetical protein n=1 Tax=Paracoccus endophyticus TaxID=2233774 RepID=UPI0013A70159|nr:hypothetical protein [Paracoccus endophyticus]
MAAYAGIEPSSVNQVMTAYGQAHRILTGGAGGNEHVVYVDAPPGYVLCNIAWHTWSVSGGSTVSGTYRSDRRQARFYANVPVQGWLSGRSWTKTMVQLHFLRDGFPWNCSGWHYQDQYGYVMFDQNGLSALSGGAFFQ